ncbi:sodium:solute symporter [Niabella soli]|uniref:Sodium:solute symporter n=1 Tax=Niabella soli DSM 19437 TaxID=929713 RepID=W0F692_9BACT|nr:sodium:solute symporter [Niabella soli]AHF16871.1 sodium:solute symporter [Niabella soli DSM 19437]
MKHIPLLDLIIILLYLAAMVWIGFYFSKKNKSADQFTKASGRIPGWAIGLSIYATFLSSNTFLGVPGKAFGSNWNAFVFSISMPFAAIFAAKYFVPFYRSTGEVSAYTHFEKRFGPWARTYAVVCFVLTQFARMGSVFFGMALSLQALLGFSMASIMVVMGICIIIYTVMGGMEAVIWTEVVQGILKTLGALLILYLILREIPGGIEKVVAIGKAHHKFSLGDASFDLTKSGFWVILLYGFFINLNNFGMDQNYVQRYHTASNSREAKKSVWLCVAMYVPASLLFFIIGTALFAYYQQHPELTTEITRMVATERLGSGASPSAINTLAASLQPADYGDKVMPHFMVYKIPQVFLGLIIAAILSAGMSTISSGMNACATVFTKDIYKRYFDPAAEGKKELKILYWGTVIFGLIGLGTGLAMLGIKSVLDVWWELSGIFSGGMLGLFLLGLISKRTTGGQAAIAVIAGVLVILWFTFSSKIPPAYAYLKIGLHINMVIVVGTLTIFGVGWLLSLRKTKAVS